MSTVYKAFSVLRQEGTIVDGGRLVVTIASIGDIAYRKQSGKFENEPKCNKCYIGSHLTTTR